MLNIYKYYSEAESLPLYNELNDLMDLLETPTWWHPSMVDQLEPLMPMITKSSVLAFCYAIFVLEGSRFPAGEPIIMKDPASAYKYAKDIIKGRWKDIGKPEAEEHIKKSESDWYVYKKHFGVE
jgi:hypothetical protein